MKTFMNKPSTRRLVEAPPPKQKSKVAIVTAKNYNQAETAVRKAIDLLGGIKKFAKRGNVVLIKPNVVAASKPEDAEVTHPAMIEAVVRIFKETGATVKVGEQTSWHGDPLTAFEVTGMKAAALRAGAEICNWDQEEYVDVDVPNGRSFSVVKLPKSLVQADVIVSLPKMKTNAGQVVSLGLKGWMGAFHNSQRPFFHKTAMDIGAVVVDVVKALGSRLKLNILDGIVGMDGGGPHSGLITFPGIVLASSDIVAFDAVACAIMDFHPFEVPATQFAMKDGLGTADLREIEVLGKTIEEVKHPFKRPVFQVVNRYPNVMEFVGGVCSSICLNGLNGLPPHIDRNKRYAIVAGARAMIGQDLSRFDEVWLCGMCASTPSHQLPGFKEKLKKAKKVYRLNYCPAHRFHLHYWQDPKVAGTDEVYSVPMMLAADLIVFSQVPDITDETKLEGAIARKEGRMSRDELMRGYTEYIGKDIAKNMKPCNWKASPLSAYANTDKEWAAPQQDY